MTLPKPASSSPSTRRGLSFVIAAFLILLPLSACSRSTQSEPAEESLEVAAAADLRYALEELKSAFSGTQEGAGVTIKVSYGSSGKLSEQILNGAPFDLFLSADNSYAKRLVEAGYVGEENTFFYASGRLAVYAPAGSNAPVSTMGITALISPEVQRISIPDPAHAPYGRAATEALSHYGLLNQVEAKFVRAENASHAAQLVDTGGADAAILPISLLKSPDHSTGSIWMIPAEAHNALLQTGVLLPKSQRIEVAKRFAQFITSDKGREILSQYGFDPPPPGDRAAGI